MESSVRFDAATIESDEHRFLTFSLSETEIYLKTVLYLRSNQIQILVPRPIEIYPQTARNHTNLVVEAVTLAKKSIRTLNTLATKSELYRTRQSMFNHFLYSSLAVLFLTAAYDAETRAAGGTHSEPPDTLLGDAVKELQAGLDLINHLRVYSHSAARLWARFHRPRQQLIRLGILSHTATIPQNQVMSNTNRGMGEADLSPDVLPATEHDELNVDPRARFDFNMADFEIDNGHLWQDWFEGGFMDSSVPFGIPAWM